MTEYKLVALILSVAFQSSNKTVLRFMKKTSMLLMIYHIGHFPTSTLNFKILYAFKLNHS